MDADGIWQGAPEAMRVADRWHLLKHPGEAMLPGLPGHSEDLKAVFVEPLPEAGESSAEALDSPAINPTPAGPDFSAHKQAPFDRIHAPRAQGRSSRSVALALDLSRNTVKKYARLGRCLERGRRPRGQATAVYETTYLVEQPGAGQRHAGRFWEEVCAQGFTGSASVVRYYVADLRRQHGVTGRRDASRPTPGGDADEGLRHDSILGHRHLPAGQPGQ